MVVCCFRDERLQELENQLSSAKEDIQQLGNERTDLIAKVNIRFS